MVVESTFFSSFGLFAAIVPKKPSCPGAAIGKSGRFYAFFRTFPLWQSIHLPLLFSFVPLPFPFLSSSG